VGICDCLNVLWKSFFIVFTLRKGVRFRPKSSETRRKSMKRKIKLREWPNFDIAFKKFGVRKQIFDSPFLHMKDSVLEDLSPFNFQFKI